MTETKRNRRCVSFASANHLVSALSVNHNEPAPFDSLEIARKSSNEEDEGDCESVSLSKCNDLAFSKFNFDYLIVLIFKQKMAKKMIQIRNLKMKLLIAPRQMAL